MVKAMSQSGGGGFGNQSAVKPEKPKKLSKAGEWRLAHPCANGANGVIYDMRAVLK